MPRLAAVCLVAVLAVLPVVVQGVYDGWHHVGANDHQTGFTNTSLISKDKGYKWTFSTNSQIHAGALITRNGNRVYVVSSDHKVHALDVKKSWLGWKEAVFMGQPSVAWTTSTGTGTADTSLSATPALSEDEQTLFVGTIDSTVLAIHTSNGTIKWKVQAGGSVSSSLLHYNGTLFYGTSNTQFTALDDRDGSKLWGCNANAPIFGSPSISADGKRVYFTSTDTYLYAVSVHTTNSVCHRKGAACPTAFHSGQFEPCADWYVKVNGNSIGTAPVVDTTIGRILITTHGGADTGAGPAGLYAITPAPNQFSPANVQPLFEVEASIRTPATMVSDDMVAFGSDDGFVYCLHINATAATLKWKFNAGAAVTSSLVTDGKTIVFGSISKQVFGLDAMTGAQLWSSNLGSQVTAPPAIDSGGGVVVGNLNGKVFAIGAPFNLLLLRIIIGAILLVLLIAFCCCWCCVCRCIHRKRSSSKADNTDDSYTTLQAEEAGAGAGAGVTASENEEHEKVAVGTAPQIEKKNETTHLLDPPDV